MRWARCSPGIVARSGRRLIQSPPRCDRVSIDTERVTGPRLGLGRVPAPGAHRLGGLGAEPPGAPSFVRSSSQLVDSRASSSSPSTPPPLHQPATLLGMKSAALDQPGARSTPGPGSPLGTLQSLYARAKKPRSEGVRCQARLTVPAPVTAGRYFRRQWVDDLSPDVRRDPGVDPESLH